jgi:D-threo-aldose 1-dehydrogenase
MTAASPQPALRGGTLALAFGGGPAGNLFAPLADADVHAAIDHAWNLGIRHFDTAPHYGRGLSERRFGDALRGRTGLTLSTKAGRVMLPDASIDDDRLRAGFRSPMPFRAAYDYSGDGILRSHEASLHRLGLAHVDLLLVHDIGAMTHGDDDAGRWEELTGKGGLAALERLRADGTVRGIGIGVNEVAACLRLMREIRLDVVMIAGRYTLLDSSALDTLLDACVAAGTRVIAAAPFNSGILATGVGGGGHPGYDNSPAPPAIVERVRAIECIASRHGVPLAAAALQFPLAHPAVTTVATGFRSAAQVEQAVAWMRHSIPADFWRALKADRLLPDHAPIPAE